MTLNCVLYFRFCRPLQCQVLCWCQCLCESCTEGKDWDNKHVAKFIMRNFPCLFWNSKPCFMQISAHNIAECAPFGVDNNHAVVYL